MDNKELDKQIKQALEGFEASFKSETWDFLEQRLKDKEQLFEENESAISTNQDEFIAIEEETKQHFEQFQVPYQPEHWWILSNKLDEIDARNRTLFRMKMMEVAMLLLLVWTIANYWAFQEQPSIATPNETEIVDTQDILNDQNNHTTLETIKNIPQNQSSKKTTIASVSSKVNKEATSNQLINNPLAETIFISEANVTVENKEKENIIQRENIASLEALPSVSFAAVSRPEWDELNTLPINTPKFVLKEEDINALATLNQPIKVLPKQWRVGLNMIGDVFGVSGTVKNEAGTLDYSSYGLGYGTGLSVGRTIGRFEVESGINYSSKDYVPASTLEIFDGNVEQGYVADGLKNIHINAVNIPLNVKYQVNKNSKWRISGVAGLSSNFILSANYDRVQVFGKNLQDIINNFKIKKGTTVNGGGLIGAGGSQTPLSAADINAIKARKDKFYKTLSNGLLEGGKVSDNFYITANAGVSLEFKINNRWSISSQTLYQQFINNSIKIGPNQDKYNSLSFSLGAKVNL